MIQLTVTRRPRDFVNVARISPNFFEVIVERHDGVTRPCGFVHADTHINAIAAVEIITDR